VGYPVPAIQIAIIARLRGDTTLRGLLVGSAAPEWNVYDADGVPVNQPCPYVVTFPITNQSGEDLSIGTDAVDTYQQISIFTESKGYAQARAIAKRVYDLFMPNKTLDLSGDSFNQYTLFFDSDQELDEDGINQHIPQRYKLQTQGG
jgi:hypothetical protein